MSKSEPKMDKKGGVEAKKLTEDRILAVTDPRNCHLYSFGERERVYTQLKEIVEEHFNTSKEVPGGAKPGEYMHEWWEEDAVLFDLPAEEIIEAMARDNRILHDKLIKALQQKPRGSKEEVDNLIWEIHRYCICGEDGEVEIQFYNEMKEQVIKRLVKKFGVEVEE